jgi:hypothetical protein
MNGYGCSRFCTVLWIGCYQQCGGTHDPQHGDHPRGVRSQQIMASVLRTCWQQGKDSFAIALS